MKAAFVSHDIEPELQLALEHAQHRYWGCDINNLGQPWNRLQSTSMEALGALLDVWFWGRELDKALLARKDIKWLDIDAGRAALASAAADTNESEAS